jgi:hypothetical protein
MYLSSKKEVISDKMISHRSVWFGAYNMLRFACLIRCTLILIMYLYSFFCLDFYWNIRVLFIIIVITECVCVFISGRKAKQCRVLLSGAD